VAVIRVLRMREGAVVPEGYSLRNPPALAGGMNLSVRDSFAVKMRVQGEDFLRNLSGAL
jgi:hypothetical protein